MNFTHWGLLGLAAQLTFASRFLVQWIVSEIKHQSVIPGYFWYASLLGSAGLLIYALHIKDPVFTLGQSFGLVVYTRNIALNRQSRRA